MSHILVDGYNFIRRSPTLSVIEAKNFEKGRLSLITKLAIYKKVKGHSVTVVFDAAMTDNLYVERDSRAGVNILYSEQNQKADEIIIDLARKLGAGAVVVSSDKEIIHAAKAAKCGVLESQEFERILDALPRDWMSDFPEAPHREKEDDKPVHKRWATKKKGNPRKLPKGTRRAMAKL